MWIRSMYVYLDSRDADCSLCIGNARQRIDIIIAHQTLQKQTWWCWGDLKCKKVESKRLVFKPVKEMLAKSPQNSQRASLNFRAETVFQLRFPLKTL